MAAGQWPQTRMEHGAGLGWSLDNFLFILFIGAETPDSRVSGSVTISGTGLTGIPARWRDLSVFVQAHRVVVFLFPYRRLFALFALLGDMPGDVIVELWMGHLEIEMQDILMSS